MVKEGQRSIENVGFPTEIEIDRDVQRKRKFLSVQVSDFGEISSILDGYFLEGIQAAVLKLMNPCYKKDLG